MRNILSLKICSPLFLIGLSACELERSDNGDLDGFWQLRDVDTLATGGTCDMRDSGITWSFQGNILELRSTKDIKKDFMMRFRVSGDTLTLTDPYHIARDSGDVKINDPRRLMPFGVHQLEMQYRILHLNSSTMNLESDELRMYFRKY